MTSYEFGKSQMSDGNLTTTSICNTYDTLVALGNQPNAKCFLKIVDPRSFLHVKVKYLPCQYNGNSLFELPAIVASKELATDRLDGMDRKFDGHAWMETHTTNVSSARCMNKDCPYLLKSNDYNDLYWDGNIHDVLILVSNPPIPSKCTLVCRYCKITWAVVHIGTYYHPVINKDCKEAIELICDQIMTQVALTSNAKNSTIGMAVEKKLLLKGLLDEHGKGRKLTKG
jgi:hypothetical protein